MTQRIATCRCGQLSATCTGEPVRVSVCHCLTCQKRSGSAFAVQARWPDAQVALTGDYSEWSRIAASGNRAVARFCPECGATITLSGEAAPGFTAVPVGAFADPLFPRPHVSVFEAHRHPWAAVTGEDLDRRD